MRISQRAERLKGSGIRRVFDLGAKLENPIDLSIGQPDFDVPEPIKEAAIRAIQDGHNRYTPTGGLPALNERLLDHVAARIGHRPEACICTSGVAGGLVLSMLALTDESDRILIPDPWFVIYENFALLVGPEPARYDTYPNFRITEERLEAGMRPDVKVVFVNSPGNPTGVVMDEDEIDAVVAFAKRHDLIVVSDEIYDAFAYDGPVASVAAKYPEGTILLSGFSKTYGMPGWRFGYACGPRDAIDKMATIQQFSFVCTPTPAQHAAMAALDVDIQPYVDAYRTKRDRLVTALAAEYELVTPNGAFYAFPKVPGGLTGTEFAERAIERNMLLVPGSAFSDRDTHVRLSFALSDEKLEEGIEALLALARDVKGG